MIIDRLLSGELSREAAASWAGKRHATEQADPVVEDALDIVVGLDARQITRTGEDAGYLFGLDEVRAVRLRLDDERT